MSPARSHDHHEAPPATPIPRWLHWLALAPMGLMLTVILLFILGFVTAGPEENLAGVLLILAAVIAVPLLATCAFWVAGYSLQHRRPGLALGLVATGAGVGVLSLLLLASVWILPALG